MEKKQIEKNIFFFRTLSEEMKNRILLTCVRNDARYYCSSYKGNDVESVIDRIWEEMENLRKVNIQIHSDSFIESYINIRDYVEKQYHDIDSFFRAEFVNCILRIQNICPMLNYAFDSWYYSSENVSSQLIIKLAELSITYLYRIVPLENISNDISCGIGAYGVIKRTSDRTVTKIPMNYAAFLFANEEEWKNFQILKNSELSKNIPTPIAFDIKTKELVREYIFGMTGHELLVVRQLDDIKINSLREMFLLIQCAQVTNGVRLDIHPANFVWNQEKSKWFLFDLGSVPYIGFDYYPKSFDAYYEKVWKERLKRMVKYPIRSVEL